MSEFKTIGFSKYLQTLETKTVFCDIHQKEYVQERILIVTTGKELITECPTCQAIRKEQEDKALVAAHIAKGQAEYHTNLVKRLFARSMIPVKFIGRTFDNFVITPDNESNLAKIKDFAANIAENLDNGRGLIMFGTKGTGKSHLSCAIAEAAIQNHYSALFITADEIIDDVKAAYSEESNTKARINQYLKPDLLIIDEIIAGIDDKETRTIAKILNARYSAKRSTIIITNLDIVSSNGRDVTLEAVIGTRILDRLRETNRALKFTGESFRKFN